MAIEGSDLRGKLLKLSKADPTPLLRDLYRHITPQYAADWKVIGTLLGLPSGELKAIEARYPISVELCCNQMLRKWLKTDTTASWEKLLTVIESPAVSGSAPDKATQLTSKLDQLTIIGKDHDTPLLKDLYKHITPQYTAHWREMGTLLGLSSKTLDIIEYDNPYNVMDCCNAMLKKWLETDTTASWRKFFTAIESPVVSGNAPDKATLLTSKQRQLIIPDNGTRLAEYEVFIQYYNKLIISLKNYETWPLFRDCVDDYDYYMVKKYIDKVISKDDPELEARTSEDTFKPKTKDISTPVMMSSKKVSLSGTEFSKEASRTGMWLAIIAIKLYYYNTGSFYKILEFMQFYNRDPGVQQLATEILSKVKEFDPLNPSNVDRTSLLVLNWYGGSQLLEFDVFMKYCSWFTELFLIFYNIDMLLHTEVITKVDRDFIMSCGRISSFNIIVIKLINQLLSGDASYFYKLLEAIQHHYMYKEVASRYRSSEVASRIQTEIYLWNRMMSTGSDCPALDDLHKLVTPHCAAQWKFIGKRLNFTPTSLKAIHDDNHGDNIKCCDALLSKWLDTDPQATWGKLIFAIDTRSAEYEVFIQYYNKLIPSLKNCTDQLFCSRWEVDSLYFHFLINDYVNEVINEDATKARMWLATIAMKLYYDSTESFYRMLQFMKSNEEDPGVQQLAAEMHTKVKEFDPLMSSGSLPIEFDVLMKYYNHLTELLWNKFDYSIFVKAEIITEKDKDFIVRYYGISGFKIILIKALNYLLSGDTNLFYKLLDNLKYIPNGDKVTLRMQTEIKLFTARYFCSVEEKCPVSECKLLSKTFDHHGGELIIEEHDVTIAVPKLAVFEGVKVEMKAVASLTGPYKLPDDCNLVSVFVWIGANYIFKKPVKITIPHFARNKDLDQRMVILTANEKDIVHRDDEYVLQMHESEFDYHYEISAHGDYCVCYTNQFCTKCLAEKPYYYNLICPIISLFEYLYKSSRRIMVFCCYPNDYKTADELKIELCICYRLEYCMQTVHKRYEQKKRKYYVVRWDIDIDKRKRQDFCLSYNDCPGWRIQLRGTKRINVNSLEFWNYSIKDLRKEEELCTYPPQFDVTIKDLEKHSKNLDIQFKITLETDGVLVSDDFQELPIPIIINEDRRMRLDHQLSADVSSTLISTTTATATTATTTTTANITSNALSTSDLSVASMTDPPEVRYLNRYVRDSLCAAGPNRWHDLGLILTGKSGKNKLDMIKIDQKHSVSGRCDAMFTLWLELDSEPSWNKLIVALREISLEAIASDLTKMRSQNE